MKSITLESPLFTNWSEQYVRLSFADITPAAGQQITVNGRPVPFQYTGHHSQAGAEVLVKLGLAAGETKEVTLCNRDEESGVPCQHDEEQNQRRLEIPIGNDGAQIGRKGRELTVGATAPFLAFAGRPMSSIIRCDAVFEGASLAQTNDGPLFTDYELTYRFAEAHQYTLTFRCYKNDPYIEVCETFSLQMGAELTWTLNPAKQFTHIISRDNFEGENQPSIEPLGAEHPRDVLCRLQMPVLTEYFIPNNRGWFAFFDERDESCGMIGVLGLYGAKWEEPVVNMPELLDQGGTVEWHSSLASGKRYWLLYAGAVEKEFEKPTDGHQTTGSGEEKSDGRFVFHRLHAEFNALRLDEHLDLTGNTVFDASCWNQPGLFDDDSREKARDKVAAFTALHDVTHPTLAALLDPTPERQRALYKRIQTRLDKWVLQFQGYREGKHDYDKNVIGFSRTLRGLLIGYELLRKDGALSEEELGRLNSLFVFAARRILDEGRWPHSRTWKHPDHPESSRDFYTYGGEHKPDRLVWTNCLPNFQSDPMCALTHLAALFPDHPDAAGWLQFALDDIDRQLDAYCGQSGAWQESINYALYTLSYMIISLRVVKNRCGIDYFRDERLRRMAAWLTRFLGPRDKRWGLYTWPAIGNSCLPTGGGEYLLCFAGELDANDPLRADLIAAYQRLEPNVKLGEHYPIVMAVMAPIPERAYPMQRLSSENMDEVGVSMRDRHDHADESYLFQKIGFAKDHYEDDETAFNWYAKGTPLCMDYGTYTGDIATAGAHNLVEIPDADSLRRGYLADHLFTPALDYTRCEVPVTLKLLWGKVRSFAEVENKDGKIDRTKTPYFYIGDKNPVGPKTWKVRMLLFVKPDYLVLFDRVYGQVSHRYNLHITGTDIQRSGALITAKGRFDLDMRAYVQHPPAFDMETGEIIPNFNPVDKPDEKAKHAQHFFRLYNRQDGLYRTLLFAQERGREVQIESIGTSGMTITTPQYTDTVFLHDDVVDEKSGDVHFIGRSGWIRRTADGQVQAVMADGAAMQAFGTRLEGRGPWAYNLKGDGSVELHGGPPRKVIISAV